MGTTVGGYWDVEVTALPVAAGPRGAALRAVGLAMGLSLGDTEALLLGVPMRLPVDLYEPGARALAEALVARGCAAVAAPSARGGIAKCGVHTRVHSPHPCAKCQVAICAVCEAHADGQRLCGDCHRAEQRTKGFFAWRVSVLLAVLAAVLVWGGLDLRQRLARNAWTRPLSVALVLGRRGALSKDEVRTLVSRVPVLQARLRAEFGRYRSAGHAPVELRLFGPVEVGSGPPAIDADGLLARALSSRRLSDYLAPIDAVAGLNPGDYDSCIYLLASPPSGARSPTVEGIAEAGGRRGVVEVELGPGMADFALVVAAHELMHTVGASDKYDRGGQPIYPDGFAEPDREPRYPQPRFELMAHGRPIATGRSEAAAGLERLAVGGATAREIGWTDRGERLPARIAKLLGW